ncbi:MAG: hypothetical protein R3F43_13405 [bacterium]
MGQRDGFLVWPREPAATRPVGERLRDHREFVLPLEGDHRSAQAGRCMDCGIPFYATRAARWEPHPRLQRSRLPGDQEAWRILKETNGFPSSPAASARPRARRPACWPRRRAGDQ